MKVDENTRGSIANQEAVRAAVVKSLFFSYAMGIVLIILQFATLAG
jgi:hypothetical protein